MNPSLKAALWCAPATCASACLWTRILSVLIGSAFTGFTSLTPPPAAVQGQQKAISHLYLTSEALRLSSFFCSEFYAIVRNKRSKYEDEDFIPMDAIHTTHKVITAALP